MVIMGWRLNTGRTRDPVLGSLGHPMNFGFRLFGHQTVSFSLIRLDRHYRRHLCHRHHHQIEVFLNFYFSDLVELSSRSYYHIHTHLHSYQELNSDQTFLLEYRLSSYLHMIINCKPELRNYKSTRRPLSSCLEFRPV